MQKYPTPEGKSAVLSCNMRLLLHPPSAFHPHKSFCVIMLVEFEHPWKLICIQVHPVLEEELAEEAVAASLLGLEGAAGCHVACLPEVVCQA